MTTLADAIREKLVSGARSGDFHVDEHNRDEVVAGILAAIVAHAASVPYSSDVLYLPDAYTGMLGATFRKMPSPVGSAGWEMHVESHGIVRFTPDQIAHLIEWLSGTVTA